MTEQLRVIQRVVLPGGSETDVLPLYLTNPAGTDANPAKVLDRRGVFIPAATTVSFCTYFNALPAAYWQRWSTVEEVRLRLRAEGAGTVEVYRSDGDGGCSRVATVDLDATATRDHEIRLPLAPCAGGGWYWFDIDAVGEVRLDWAEWCAVTARPAGSVSIGITTFNRPKFCVELLTAVGTAADLRSTVDEVIVVDQGHQRIQDHPGYDRAVAALDGRLRIVQQQNLGSAGGFSRAMDEVLRSGRSTHVLLLDDDIALREPESVHRLIAFADLARDLTIVGGHMFDLLQRPVMHVFGETVERSRWWTAPVGDTHYAYHLGKEPLRTTAALHRRADVDFNGWWMALVPVEAIRRVGLTMPVFIKWDDVEYGLRAAAAGVPTVSLPGAGVWHMPWYAKDIATDWQVYFQSRNRIITALAHSPHERGGRMPEENLLMCLKHAMTLEYSAAELMLLGVEDALRGPDQLTESLAARLAQLQASGSTAANARGKLAKRHPELVIPFADGGWWWRDDIDSVLVTSAEGVSTTWQHRESERFASLVRRTRDLHRELLDNWPRLAAQYRQALPRLVSPEQWRDSFGTAER